MRDAMTNREVSPQKRMAGTAQDRLISQQKGATALLRRVIDAGSALPVPGRDA